VTILQSWEAITQPFEDALVLFVPQACNRRDAFQKASVKQHWFITRNDCTQGPVLGEIEQSLVINFSGESLVAPVHVQSRRSCRTVHDHCVHRLPPTHKECRKIVKDGHAASVSESIESASCGFSKSTQPSVSDGCDAQCIK
jgi:hypothetical protein